MGWKRLNLEGLWTIVRSLSLRDMEAIKQGLTDSRKLLQQCQTGLCSVGFPKLTAESALAGSWSQVEETASQSPPHPFLETSAWGASCSLPRSLPAPPRVTLASREACIFSSSAPKLPLSVSCLLPDVPVDGANVDPPQVMQGVSRRGGTVVQT